MVYYARRVLPRAPFTRGRRGKPLSAWVRGRLRKVMKEYFVINDILIFLWIEELIFSYSDV